MRIRGRILWMCLVLIGKDKESLILAFRGIGSSKAQFSQSKIKYLLALLAQSTRVMSSRS